MKYKVDNEDYLKLWIYFEDRATSVKAAMFTTITWVVGFMAALLGFIFASLANDAPSKAPIELPTLMRLATGAGIVLCIYAFLALRESAKHIRNNWKYADHCLTNIEGLSTIVSPSGLELNKRNNPSQQKLWTIWNQLRLLVALFMLAFAGIFVWSFFIYINA
jgi:hypothetical protein